MEVNIIQDDLDLLSFPVEILDRIFDSLPKINWFMFGQTCWIIRNIYLYKRARNHKNHRKYITNEINDKLLNYYAKYTNCIIYFVQYHINIIPKNITTHAVTNDNIDLVSWIKKYTVKYLWDESLCKIAIQNENFQMLRCLIEEDCPHDNCTISKDHVMILVKNNDLDLLIFLPPKIKM